MLKLTDGMLLYHGTFVEISKVELETGFDIIGGKIANDRTARTLQLYTSGGYGVPGSQAADDIAIMTLLPNRLEEQFCFCTEKAMQTLEFVRSDSYDINHK